MTNKLPLPPTQNDVIQTVNNIIDDLAGKQDILTAGTNISIVDVPGEPIDTRSTATIQTVGSNRWQKVAYGNGVFVIVGNDGYISRSTDNGETWTTPVQIGTRSWYGIAYGNGIFVVVGNNGYTTRSTDNGETWSTPVQINNSLSNRLQDVVYGNGVFIAIGWDGRATTTSDGATWTNPVPLGLTRGQSIIYDGTKFVVLGDSSGGYYSDVTTSTDNGTTWTTTVTISETYPNATAIGYNNGIYLAFFGSGTFYSYSSDCTNWSEPIDMKTLVNNGNNITIQNVYGTYNGFIVVGRRALSSGSNPSYKYTTILTSNGINWDEPIDIGESATSSSIQFGFLGIVFGNNKYIAVGDVGAITHFQISAGSEGRTVINGAEIVSSVSSSSTNSECVGAKLFYDTVGDIETALNTINSGSNT